MTRLSYFPVVRRGRLVRTLRKADGEQCALTFEQSERALTKIERRADEFLSAIKKGLEDGAAHCKAKLVWREADGEVVVSLAPARRNRGLGAIFDFAEIAFDIDGATVIARGCVTLCVEPGKMDPEADDGGEGEEARRPYSKFWMRYILVTHPESKAPGGRAVDLPQPALAAFDTLCGPLTERAMQLMAPLYAEVVGRVVEEEVELDFGNAGMISVLAVSSANTNFPDAFNSVRAGASVTELAREKGGAARQLVDLAVSALGVGGGDGADLFEDDDYHFLAYESIDADRGLFLAHFGEKEARFVGIASAPRDRSAELVGAEETLTDVHNSSANIVSAGLVAQYARRF